MVVAKWGTQDALTRFARLMLGLVFLAAAFTKGFDLVLFGRRLEEMAWIIGFDHSDMLAMGAFVTAVTTTSIELLLGIALVTGIKARISSWVAICLLTCFLIGTVWIALSGKQINCGCFGNVLERTVGQAVFDDVILLAVAWFAARARRSDHRYGWFGFGLLVIGIVWGTAFYYQPLKGSALRPGVTIKLEEPLTQDLAIGNKILWFFDTECNRCQLQLGVVKQLATDGYAVTGVTHATRGRIDEYILDFVPTFPIFLVTPHQINHFGVHTGTLVSLREGVVQQIWTDESLSVRSLEKQLIK